MRVILTAVAATLMLAGPAAAQTVWDMPTGYAPNNFHTVNDMEFAKRVEEATGGKLKINVHPGASLYKAPEIKRAIQTGQAQIGEVLMVLHTNENPMYAIDGMPFLATSYEDAKKLADLQRPYIEKLLADQGIKLLFTVPWPPQGLHSKKAIDGIEGMKGEAHRAYSKQTSRLAELAGAHPTVIQAAEVTQALATGKITSLITSAQSGVDYKVWESLKYFYDMRGWMPKNMVIVSQSAFDALDAATQKAVLAEAKRAEEAGWAASKRVTEETTKALADNGINVVVPDAAWMKGFKAIGDTMLDEWLAEAGPDVKKVVADFKK